MCCGVILWIRTPNIILFDAYNCSYTQTAYMTLPERTTPTFKHCVLLMTSSARNMDYTQYVRPSGQGSNMETIVACSAHLNCEYLTIIEH